MQRIAGFTLIELLVTIAIIGILAATVLASLGSARDRSKVARTQTELREIAKAAESLSIHTGLYPHKSSHVCPPQSAANNEIDVSLPEAGLVGTDGTYPNWAGPYMPPILDPWGTPYFLDEDYQCTDGVDGCDGVVFSGSNYTSALISCGPDKATSPSNGDACAYNEDNIVRVYCQL
jgi:prepilin-type N-terminal cleavage/methylation domain-containing protein